MSDNDNEIIDTTGSNNPNMQQQKEDLDYLAK